MTELNKKQLQKLRNKYTLNAIYEAEYENEKIFISLKEINSCTYKFYYYDKKGDNCFCHNCSTRPAWTRDYHNQLKITKLIKYI